MKRKTKILILVLSLAAAGILLFFILKTRKPKSIYNPDPLYIDPSILSNMNENSIIDTTRSWITPMPGRFTQKYKITPDNPKGHNGLDIAANTGTPIVSPSSGVVVSKWFDDEFGGGNSMRVKHDNGYITGYAHLSAYNVEKGDRVNKGDLLAYCGNTGFNSMGSHLHFTLRDPEGVLMDPLGEIYPEINIGEYF